MSKQNETKFKEKVLADLRLIPNLWFVKTQMLSTGGIPDVLMCVRGVFFAWELKTSKGKATKLQEHVLTKIKNAEGFAYVVTPENYEERYAEVYKTAMVS